ncbi:MAG: PDZ domain-containing protein [Planctomycetota bacterium]
MRTPLFQSSAGRLQVDGLLGAALLAHLRFLIDPVGQVLHLAPASSWTEHYPMMPGIIFQARTSGFVVESVGRQSPAERAGVRAGDLIAAVAGTPLQGQSVEALKRLFTVEEGKTWTITIERGDETMDMTIPIEAWPPRLQRSASGARRGS